MHYSELTQAIEDVRILSTGGGKKIEAIKYYRETFGSGLKDSKDAVEALMDLDVRLELGLVLTYRYNEEVVTVKSIVFHPTITLSNGDEITIQQLGYYRASIARVEDEYIDGWTQEFVVYVLGEKCATFKTAEDASAYVTWRNKVV